MTPDEARSLTDRIAAKVGDAMADIESAWRGRADEALGYESWGDYCRAEFQGVQLRPREERPALVGALAQSGMSNVAIAEALGVGATTVRRDLAGSPNGEPDLPAMSTGKDGKKYPRRRKPITQPRPMDADTAATVAHIIDRKTVTKWLANTRQAVADLHRVADSLDVAYSPLLPTEQQTIRVILDALTVARQRLERHAQ